MHSGRHLANGSVVPTIPPGFIQATGSELYQTTTGAGPALIRGPDYNSPDDMGSTVV